MCAGLLPSSNTDACYKPAGPTSCNKLQDHDVAPLETASPLMHPHKMQEQLLMAARTAYAVVWCYFTSCEESLEDSQVYMDRICTEPSTSGAAEEVFGGPPLVQKEVLHSDVHLMCCGGSLWRTPTCAWRGSELTRHPGTR